MAWRPPGCVNPSNDVAAPVLPSSDGEEWTSGVRARLNEKAVALSPGYAKPVTRQECSLLCWHQCRARGMRWLIRTDRVDDLRIEHIIHELASTVRGSMDQVAMTGHVGCRLPITEDGIREHHLAPSMLD